MKKQIVYAVTSGCYSDYRIRGLFSTCANADKFISICRAAAECYYDKDFDIEEWTLDVDLAQKTYTRYLCGLMLDTGEQVEKYTPQQFFGVPVSRSYVAESVPVYKGRGIARAESHKSAEHAHKLAVEARQKYLREHK